MNGVPCQTQPFNTLSITEDRSACARRSRPPLANECSRQDGGGTRFAAMAFADKTNTVSLSPPTRADVCANCNVSAGASREAAGDGAVVLKKCTACLLVKYCSVDCQRNHRNQHKKECKRRAAELKDERLYGQGRERPEGDFCPICTLPIRLRMDEHSVFNTCCMKRVCKGCCVAMKLRGMVSTCPFCRTPTPDDDTGCLSSLAYKIRWI